MTAEEELIHLRQENRLLREQASVQQETISVQQELINRQQEQITLLERELSLQQEQMTQFAEQVQRCKNGWLKIATIATCPPPRIASAVSPRVCAKRAGSHQVGKKAMEAARCGSRRALMRCLSILWNAVSSARRT